MTEIRHLQQKYCVVQAGYWSNNCLSFGFATAFLAEEGVSVFWIGVLTSLGCIAGLILQFFWGGSLISLGGSNCLMLAGVVFCMVGAVITFVFSERTENGHVLH